LPQAGLIDVCHVPGLVVSESRHGEHDLLAVWEEPIEADPHAGTSFTRTRG
jgi:hypothetical protein